MSLTKQFWLRYAPDLLIELEQCRDEGKDVTGLTERIAAVQALPVGDPKRESEAVRLLDETIHLSQRSEYPYTEPSDLAGILQERPAGLRRMPVSLNPTQLFDRIYGAWLGRCAGCLLGIPVEGWTRERLIGFNRAIGNYPPSTYMSSDQAVNILDEFGVKDEPHYYTEKVPWINNIDCAPIDDDTNYTIINLRLLEDCGFEFTSEDVGLTWLNNLPLLQLCTAERIAYRNMANLILPPASATHRNVYREWIGAQIRGDCFGYINPGWMERAAEMAWRDACVSHVKNGIYGEMWVAAMLSAAYITDDLSEVVRMGLSELPARSRFSEAIQKVLSWREEQITWEQALDRVHQRWNERNYHHWGHAVSNAMIVAIALLYGKGELEQSLAIAVSAGFDTDCNGATVGSIVGLKCGASSLPGKWIDPLHDRLRSSVREHENVAISELANRAVELAKQTIGR